MLQLIDSLVYLRTRVGGRINDYIRLLPITLEPLVELSAFRVKIEYRRNGRIKIAIGRFIETFVAECNLLSRRVVK